MPMIGKIANKSLQRTANAAAEFGVRKQMKNSIPLAIVAFFFPAPVLAWKRQWWKAFFAFLFTGFATPVAFLITIGLFAQNVFSDQASVIVSCFVTLLPAIYVAFNINYKWSRTGKMAATSSS